MAVYWTPQNNNYLIYSDNNCSSLLDSTNLISETKMCAIQTLPVSSYNAWAWGCIWLSKASYTYTPTYIEL